MCEFPEFLTGAAFTELILPSSIVTQKWSPELLRIEMLFSTKC